MSPLSTLIPVLLILLLGRCCLTDIYTHDRKRPVPLLDSTHSCLGRFEVSENTIIRAQDSKQLGAHFLNESDVGNREDCMALCCRTRGCNVAVFEEKNLGSCFLFDCGTADNFICKFTTHSYYTSTRVRDPPPPPPPTDPPLPPPPQRIVWSRARSQHEQELNNLRAPDLQPVSQEEVNPFLSDISQQQVHQTDPSTTTTTTTTTTATTKRTSVVTTPPATTTTKGRQCSRFQFECHSGECVAIYNACDGIVQCADGSDEGPALNCPSQHEASSRGLEGGDNREATGAVGVASGGGAGLMAGEGRGREAGEEPNRGRETRLQDSDPAAGTALQQQQQQHAAGGRLGYGGERGIFSHHATLLDSYGRYSGPNSPENLSGYSNREDGAGYGGRGKGPGYYDYSVRPPYSGARFNAGDGGYELRPAPYHRGDYPDYPTGTGPYSARVQGNTPQRVWGDAARLSGLPATLPQQQQQQQGLQQHQQQGLPQLPLQQQQMQQEPQLLSSYLNPMQQTNDPLIQQQEHQQLHQELQQLPAQHTQLQLQRQQLLPIADQMAESGGRETGYRIREKMLGQQLVEGRGGVVPDREHSSIGVPRQEAESSSKYVALNAINNNTTTTTTITNSAVATTTMAQNPPATANSTSNANSNDKAIPFTSGGSSSTSTNSTSPPSTSILDTSSILGSWSSIVSKWRLDPVEVEAGQVENSLQHSGAVLALSLGLTVSAVLMILIGCRVRGLRRRRHRGGRSPYAHDADYLVNGMYL